jgi:hypothetical protein
MEVKYQTSWTLSTGEQRCGKVADPSSRILWCSAHTAGDGIMNYELVQYQRTVAAECEDENLPQDAATIAYRS